LMIGVPVLAGTPRPHGQLSRYTRRPQEARKRAA
jgi:hypothetical protein